MFLIALFLIVMFTLMAIAPRLFTGIDPLQCDLAKSRETPSADAWFGYDGNGCSVYARTIYGARASMAVGVLTTLFVTITGLFLGTIGGFYGRFTDTIVSRVGDIFFGIPLLLGALLVLVTFPSDEFTPAWLTIMKVVIAWHCSAGVDHAHLEVERAAGAQFRHVSLRERWARRARASSRDTSSQLDAPVIVVATISLAPTSVRRRRCPSSASAFSRRSSPGAS
jgi:oligopeptide transport system permease protein